MLLTPTQLIKNTAPGGNHAIIPELFQLCRASPQPQQPADHPSGDEALHSSADPRPLSPL